ncbi:heterokaryon incompatibility protein-domain-containing protein [Pyrenochaeta sp. MPI-SDFR-AT-0127]|nr:heterokaryon incompatibility protein-domain-containing protein [Pyrenochaeta sp. MPI-SDFR-AT-0127]
MSCNIPPYPYSPLLPGPDSIRLLYLRPPEDENAPIRCQLFDYSLDGSDKAPPRYEALSYVWGDPKNTRSLFIDEHEFKVTVNLHAALWRLRNRGIDWVWVDAICINQQDQQERGHQVRSMAKIYGIAYRVVVWLGQTEHDSDRAFEEIRARKKWSDASDDPTIKHAVLALLERPWFRRIWILQEIAAARRILVVCGSAEIDGYGFCIGLKSLEAVYKSRPDLYNLVRSVTYLIRQANFRPTHGICWSDMRFLAIGSIGELVDMFHAHKATERHDKVYALLGMSSDALDAADLLPDYNVPWGQVMKKLIKFLLGNQVITETWDDKEVAVIKSKGFVLGEVSSVIPCSGWGDTHKVDITSKDTKMSSGSVGWWSAHLTLHNSAKSIRAGDLVYLPQGAFRPIIIRICKDHFTVIMITATPPKDIRTHSGYVRWSELLRTVRPSPHDFLLIWDWNKTPEVPEEYETLVDAGGQAQEHSKTERKVARLVDMALILEDLKEYEELKESFQEAIKLNERAFGKKHVDMLTSINNLALTYSNRGWWWEAEKMFYQVTETSKRVQGEDHPSTLTSIGNLASTYSNQGRWKEAEELEVQVVETSKRVLGEKHPDTLISMNNLASTFRNQGRWTEAQELFTQVIEAFKSVLGPDHPSTLTSMANLALTYSNQGRWYEAEELLVQVIETSKKVLGQQHPDTLINMNYLGATYRNQGQWKKAENILLEVIETSKKVIAENHPSTLTSMVNLALTYSNQGRWHEAEELLVQATETFKSVFGDKHPFVLTNMGSLAFILKAQARDEEAVALMEKCLQQGKQALGPQHPYVQSYLEALDQWRAENLDID